METGWQNSFTAGAATGDDVVTNNSFWNISSTPGGATRYDNWSNSTARVPEASVIHALLFGVTNTTTTTFHDTGVGYGMPDPHMMCLKLGKRHYYEDAVVVTDRHVTADQSSSAATKRGTRVRVTSSTRCQVEGCHVALGNAKEYYRRHKVCEIHSKAPNVLLLGLQQRFCQQCSRFHDVTEFDEAKRSCRRRLKGHNLRRRKGTFSNSLPRSFPHSHENNYMMKQRLGPLSTLPPSSPPLESQSKPVCALSLLSSPKTEPWISTGDLSSRCSAALYELIAANRASSISGHFLDQNSSHQPISDNAMHTSHETQMWDRSTHTTMTFDVKQAPALDFGLLSMKEKSKDPEEWTDYCWSPFGGTNVV
ncbi:hypothetical protein L1987_76832 [Smallanthus sonchifolius]|uniref:Uncharacterized protein n=1 Tax=Smallanthus sonchifolius TaxID=185202 RepID=A0ACB8Z7B8_9ASTR|nr:hypothetical protein L1987_76832 [Smallanthus sonchifolius]